MKDKKFIRRSITIPMELEIEIKQFVDKYSFRSKNDFFIELLELGLLKYKEDQELKYKIDLLIRKIEDLLSNDRRF